MITLSAADGLASSPSGLHINLNMIQDPVGPTKFPQKVDHASSRPFVIVGAVAVHRVRIA